MNPRSVRAGALAGSGLALFYVVVVAAASGSWEHLTDQAGQDWYYLVAAELEVAGTPWQVAGSEGDGHGGHHREGDLRLEASGAAVGTAQLTLPGFPEPVEATWELEG